MVAVISNGTAILGLGNLGALASKPVMEGKAVLFKRFADVDSIDLEVDTEDVDEFVNCVRLLGRPSAASTSRTSRRPTASSSSSAARDDGHPGLPRRPARHRHHRRRGPDQRAASDRPRSKTTKIVCNGAGAAAIACIELIKAMGCRTRIIALRHQGRDLQGRATEGMNQWKSAHAVKTEARTLADAMDGADVFLGLSVKGALTRHGRSMADNPMIFAMANPDPEITPEEVAAIRSDAIMATGRSDYPNQVNNVLGFPYIFRGALDVRATAINEEMKIAAPMRWPRSPARTCPTMSPPPMPATGRFGPATSSRCRSIRA
jgi:malate dehydrogenase (oxaloacetate-decarboxylating)(NADP+)